MLRDSYGTWFDAATDFGLDIFPVKPLFHHHALRLAQRAGVLDQASFAVRAEGLYCEAEVDITTEAGRTIMDLVTSGRAFWSSGVMPHMIGARADGYIQRWPVAEGSVTDTPAARKGLTTVEHLRAFLPDGFDVGPDVELRRYILMTTDANGNGTNNGVPGAPAPVQTPPPAAVPGSGDVLNALQALATQMTDLGRRVDDLSVRRVPVETANPVQPPGRPNIQVSSRYDDVSLLGLCLWDRAQTLIGNRSGVRAWQRDEPFMRAVLDKMNKERELLPHSTGIRAVDAEAMDDWRRYIPNLRADEAMGSTVAGYGDELVPTLLNSQVHYWSRLATKVFGLIPSFQMPSNPFNYPTVTGGPTVRKVAENVHQAGWGLTAAPTPTSKIGTGSVTFSVGKAGALSLLPTELFEDAAVNVADIAAQTYVIAMAKALDDIILNGDESADVNNISHLGVDPTATVYDSRLIVDGLRHLAIIDTATDSVAIATLATTSIFTLAQLMGARGILGVDVQNQVVILDPGSYYKAVQFTDFLTIDKIGERATLLTGQVGSWAGRPLVVSDEIEYTDAAGKYPSAHNGTKGQQILLRPDLHRIGFMREVKTEMGNVPGVDGMYIMSSMRFDMKALEVGGVAVGFNTTV